MHAFDEIHRKSRAPRAPGLQGLQGLQGSWMSFTLDRLTARLPDFRTAPLPCRYRVYIQAHRRSRYVSGSTEHRREWTHTRQDFTSQRHTR